MDRNYAYISIHGKANTSLITDALGIIPTKEWNVGDKRENGTLYNFSHWEYKLPEFEQEFMDDALLKVIEFINEKKLDFSKIPHGFEAFISCVGWHEKRSPGFHISKDMIMQLGKIGIAVDFDLYCHAQ